MITEQQLQDTTMLAKMSPDAAVLEYQKILNDVDGLDTPQSEPLYRLKEQAIVGLGEIFKNQG